MNALYISGHNTSEELSFLLKDALIEVEEVVNVIDAIGLMRLGAFHCVFIYDKTVDIPIDKAYKMLGKFVEGECVFVLSNNSKTSNFDGVWVQVPKNKSELSEIIQMDLPNPNEIGENRKTDLTQLKELANGDADFFLDILETFTQDCPGFINKLEMSVNSNNIVEVGKIAHKIKSPLKLLGVNALDNHIDFLDDMGLENPNNVNWTEISISANTILEWLNDVLLEIKEELIATSV